MQQEQQEGERSWPRRQASRGPAAHQAMGTCGSPHLGVMCPLPSDPTGDQQRLRPTMGLVLGEEPIPPTPGYPWTSYRPSLDLCPQDSEGEGADLRDGQGCRSGLWGPGPHPQLSHREPGEQGAAMALDKGFLQPLLPHPSASLTAHVPSESTTPRNHNWNNRASLVGAELCMGPFMLVTHLILSNP